MTYIDQVRLAGSRGRLSEHAAVDPVTAEVIRGAMETICFEMAEYVSRTATSPMMNQSNERNATILDAQGRLAALSVGIPQFMLTSTPTTRTTAAATCPITTCSLPCSQTRCRPTASGVAGAWC
jgi:N-methylhydantoinase B